jgi:haloalkane dehalogenase
MVPTRFQTNAPEITGSMAALRTPDARFENLPGYPFAAHWHTLASGLRLHYLDEGPRDAPIVLMLHGEPSWSYLYRKMIPPLVQAGFRAVAPDLVGFGKSDKPPRLADYSYRNHVDWLREWLEALDLRGLTLFCQDWGSLLGLRLAAEHESRFARIVVANGGLPTGDRAPSRAFGYWRAFATYSPWFPIGRIVNWGCLNPLSPAEIAAYDAPFPSSQFKAGARAFPRLVPTDPANPATPANRAAWDKLGQWRKPFLTIFGQNDPILGRGDKALQKHVPGAQHQPHARIPGGHFLQEDQGPELARRTIEWIRGFTA